MAYIDDATNRVFARFYDYEGTIPAKELRLKEIKTKEEAKTGR